MAISWQYTMPLWWLSDSYMPLTEQLVCEAAMRSVLASPISHHNRHNRRR